MDYPLVSVIMPVYNVAEFVAEAIKSVLSQTYSNIEFYNVAAMPKVVGEYNVGYGLKELLESWIENRTYLNSNKKEEPFDSFSEFDKLSIKFKGDINE